MVVVLWPVATRAFSRPASARTRVANAWRSWCGCQRCRSFQPCNSAHAAGPAASAPPAASRAAASSARQRIPATATAVGRRESLVARAGDGDAVAVAVVRIEQPRIYWPTRHELAQDGLCLRAELDDALLA